MTWPKDILENIAPILLQDKIAKYSEAYTSLRKAEWAVQCQSMSMLIDYRDFVEEKLEEIHEVICTESFLKTLKSSTKRTEDVVEFLSSQFKNYMNKMTTSNIPKEYVSFCLDKELETYFEMARAVSKFRPLLKCSRESVEKTLQSMELRGQDITIYDMTKYMKDLKLPTLWSVLAMYSANETGDAEELFLHPPLPRIFGNESKRDLVKSDPTKIVRRSKTNLDFNNSVVAGSGYIGFMADKMTIVEAKQAHLIAPLPGLANHIWALNPTTREAAIFDLRPFRTVLEFELPASDDVSNWIDCQRDAEGTLALLWGHINSLTGCLNTQNMIGLDEDTFDLSKPLLALKDRSTGFKVDWRDHSNLLNIHHSVNDDGTEERHFTHEYNICFGENLLMTLTTDSRPIESIYGEPHELFLLSPLSASQTLQHWTLENGKYCMKKSSALLKPPRGQWSSLCVL